MIFSALTDEELVKLVELDPKATELNKVLASRINERLKIHRCYQVRFERISSIATPEDEEF